MYLSHYGLNQSPFGITPNPDFFYTGNQRGAILEALIYAVTHGEGIIKVTGEVGSGKTMLCRMLESMLPDKVVVIYLVNPTLSREEVGYAIAGELGLKGDGLRADEVVRLLQNDLIARHVAGQQVVLLVEEAQAMPLDTLEEIRLFSNLETAHHKLLQIVLFGQPELDESLDLPRMRQLKERITHSFKVPPLAPTLLPEFLMFRMRAAGYRGPDVFTKGAMKQIADVSEGIVRRVSILADKALLAAFADNTHAITTRHVKAAVRDSQFAASRTRRRRRATLALAAAAALLAAGLGGWAGNAARTQAAPLPPPPLAKAAPAAPQAAPAAALPASATPVAPAWLQAQRPQHYTLQLALADPDPGQRERQLRKFGDELGRGNVYLFPTKAAGQPRYGLLYGSYPSRAEALAMREQLVKEWAYQPQLRTFAGVREEMRRTGAPQVWPK
ncbi:MAG: AAA family ATPase [Telluria sp.]